MTEKLINCVVCGFTHLREPPTDETLQRFYDTYVYEGKTGRKWFEKEQDEYFSGLWDAMFKYQAEMLGNADEGDGLIDWGCGTGYFLVHWWKNGGVGFGIEPSEQARRWIDDLVPTYKKLPNNLPFRDRITHSRVALVLEHLLDPWQFMVQLVIPNTTGNIQIIVPNEFNPLQLKVGGDWFVEQHHVNYFSQKTFERFIDRLGLEAVHKTATFPMELFILAGLDYRQNDILGQRLHRARLKFENMLPKIAFGLYKSWFDKHGWGRELVYTVRRKVE